MVYIHYSGDVSEPAIFKHEKPDFTEWEIVIPRKHGLFGFFYHQFHYYRLLFECLKSLENLKIIHAQVTWKSGFDAIWLRRKFSLPVVITEHNTDWLPEDGQSPRWKRRLSRWALFRSQSVVAVSQRLADALSIAIHKPVAFIPNAVHKTFTDEPRMVFPPQNKLVFIHVSNFNIKQKQTDKIIHVFSQFARKQPTAILELNVPEQAFYAYKAANPQHDWTRIHWLAPTPNRRELADRIQGAHYLVSFSLYETFGLTIAEAVCLGVPVIYTHCKGADALITENMGIACDARSEASLLRAFIMAAETTDWNYEEIAGKAKSLFSGDAVLDAYSDIYRKIK